jgi:hypothetical protein
MKMTQAIQFEPSSPSAGCAFEDDYDADDLAEEFLGFEFPKSTKHNSTI